MPKIQENYLQLMRVVISHLGLLGVPTININSMCGEWNIKKEKLHQILVLLKHLETIRIPCDKKDWNRLSRETMLFQIDPTLDSVLSGNKESCRKALALVCAFLAIPEREVCVGADESQYDFALGEFTLEMVVLVKSAKLQIG